MGKRQLNRLEALNLITPVLDKEASAEERKAFFEYIAKHPEIRRKFVSASNIKKLLADRFPRAQAPDSLKKRVNAFLSTEKQAPFSEPPPYEDLMYDISCQQKPGNLQKPTSEKNRAFLQAGHSRWIFSAVASLFIVVTAWTFYGFSFEPNTDTAEYYVEESAYEHFIEHEEQFIEPNIVTATLGSAEETLASDYDISVTIPKLDGARFEGVVFQQFVPEYDAPMLEYYIPDEDQYIYIFAFDLEELQDFGSLLLNPEAVEACKRPEDFHVQEVQDKYIVSWRWGDTWYTAISNRNGEAIASSVEAPH